MELNIQGVLLENDDKMVELFLESQGMLGKWKECKKGGEFPLMLFTAANNLCCVQTATNSDGSNGLVLIKCDLNNKELCEKMITMIEKVNDVKLEDGKWMDKPEIPSN